MDNSKASIVPDNTTGSDSDVSLSVTLQDIAQAKQFFNHAKQKLLNVNHWHEWSGKGSAVFQLTDEYGHNVERAVRLGDHFKIDIPLFGNISGNGYDWVQVEAVEENYNDNKDEVALRVRPTDDPTNAKNDVAHFFSDEASSTFSIIRVDNTVTASVQGRNERPNTGTGNVADKIRNTIVAAGAMIGLNKPQWKSLVKGLMSEVKSNQAMQR